MVNPLSDHKKFCTQSAENVAALQHNCTGKESSSRAGENETGRWGVSATASLNQKDFARDSPPPPNSETLKKKSDISRFRDLSNSDEKFAGIPSLTLPSGKFSYGWCSR